MFVRTKTILFPSESALCIATGTEGGQGLTTASRVALDKNGLFETLLVVLRKGVRRFRFVIPEENLYLTQVKVPESEADRSRIVPFIESIFPEVLSEIAWDFQVVGMEDGQALVEVSGMRKEFGVLLQ